MNIRNFMLTYRYSTDCPARINQFRWAAMVRSYLNLLKQIEVYPTLEETLY